MPAVQDETSSIRALLVSECQHLGLTLSAGEIDGVVGYVRLLRKWNQRINLVGTRDLPVLMRQHIADSLVLCTHVSTAPARLIDVGSGGGLPGVLIAILRPAVQVMAVEPIHKKHAFLATAQRELSLKNLCTRALRMEALKEAPGFAAYDIAVSRATFALPEWLERGCTLVREGGTVLAMEGRERHALPAGAERFEYELGDRTRAIVAMRARAAAAGVGDLVEPPEC